MDVGNVSLHFNAEEETFLLTGFGFVEAEHSGAIQSRDEIVNAEDGSDFHGELFLVNEAVFGEVERMDGFAKGGVVVAPHRNKELFGEDDLGLVIRA